MSRVTLVLTDALYAELAQAASHELETAGVLLARPIKDELGELRLLATDVRWCPPEAYAERHADALSITPEGYVSALGQAAADDAVAIWLHTHPGDGSSPQPSRHDHKVNDQLKDVFRLRTESKYYGWLIISRLDNQLRFAGGLLTDEGSVAVARIWCVGDRFRLLHHDDRTLPQTDPIFDRNVRAFGGPVQAALGDLNVAIVGCGGTGSAVAEQLVRLGVRRFLLIDPDELSDSNITRVYGSTPKRVGDRKVDVLADLITAIAPSAEVRRESSMLTAQATAKRLVGTDVIFGCTDDNAGRLILSRFASYMLTPVIDCGVLLTSSAEGQLEGINGRVTVLSPGNACLVCRGRIDQARAASELLTPEERIRRADEGYAVALPGVEPAVVTFTTAVAAAAVTELIERFVGYGPQPVPSELILRLHDRELSTNHQVPHDGHYCDPSAGKLGVGLTVPFLGQMWMA